MDVSNEKIVYVDSRAINKPASKRPQFQVRPWHRYWARMIDFFIFSLVLDTALYYAFDFLSLSYFERIILSTCLLITWVPIEAILLSTLGTTFGKWLFNIQVRDEHGVKLPLRDALNRSLKVLIRGMGGGIPLVSFLCLISAHSKLVNEGITSWDKGDFKITHFPLGLLKKIICIAVVIGYLYVRFIEKIDLFRN